MSQTRVAIQSLISGTEVRLALQQIAPARAIAHDVAWFEALMRPACPSVLDLVRLAQCEGQGPAVDRAVWESALRLLAIAPQIDRLSINVTPATLETPGFAVDVLARTAMMEIDPSRIVAEVSELFGVTDEATALANVTALADAGVKIAIDDFGGGHAHLRLVATGAVSIIKLDPGLIEGVATGTCKRGRDVVAGLVRFARQLGIEVVAEGISSEAADDLAAVAGADWLQGYAVHSPEPASDVIQRLHASALARAA